jgi:GGDEF domain-containing protein
LCQVELQSVQGSAEEPTVSSGPLASQTTSARAALDLVADQLADSKACPGSNDILVVALRPGSDRRRVVGTAGNSAIRAAISVAVAAGNLRPWTGADAESITDVPVGALPEIIRSTVAPNGIQSVRVGVLHESGEAACLTMWLSTAPAISVAAERCHVDVLRRLSDALEADYERIASMPQIVATPAPADAEPRQDATLADSSAWANALDQLESDETGIIVLAIDGADALDRADSGRADRLRQLCANRLVATLPRHTLVARLEPDTYAVLLANTDRHDAFETSRRLRNEIGLALADVAADHVPVAVGFVHEDGLVDPEELFGSAMSALREARQSGGTMMLVAC